MRANQRIFVAGHRGLVGSAVVRSLKRHGFQELVTRTRSELDLSNTSDVEQFFRTVKPHHIFLCAAKVGGICANSRYPAEFISANLAIQQTVIEASYRHGVERLLFLGSSCVYPRDCPQPIRESYLLTGPLEVTNRPYAVAKIAGIEMCRAFNRQYATRYLVVMPTNLYGPEDNYDLETSHVLPAMIRKMHEAKIAGHDSVELWGSGAPRREFLSSEDMADACVYLMNLDARSFDRILRGDDGAALINVGVGRDISIRDLAALVAEVVGFEGEIRWDTTRPDGTPQKLLDVSRLSQTGWVPKIELAEGIRRTYAAFVERCSASPSTVE